jgi:hypothetical protein
MARERAKALRETYPEFKDYRSQVFGSGSRHDAADFSASGVKDMVELELEHATNFLWASSHHPNGRLIQVLRH